METISISNNIEKSEVSGSVLRTPISDEMQKSYLDYAMSVIVARALPDARDGLKPVQRRIIYAMHEQGMHYNDRYQKCAAVVGEVLKKYHPHGDTSVYEALVRMGQDFSLRYPLIDGQGNFGSIDNDPPAAMRYTESRLSKISDDLLLDIDKETVDFVPNYSGDYTEPPLLPALIPNLLLNGATGIAVGMATNIPPHNLGEIVDALTFLIDKTENPETLDFSSIATIEELLNFIKGPDFPTGGFIYNQKDILQTYATGRGRILTRARAIIEEEKNGKFCIVVTEIPYQVYKSALIEKIAELVHDKKIDGISDLRDESNKEGIRVVIELRKDAAPKLILNLLYKHTDMQKAFNSNFVALINNEPRIMNLKTILEEFVKHRQVVVGRRTKFLLKKAQEREHILQGLKIALDHIDAVINTIRASKDADSARKALMEKFGLTEIQANAILEMQLRRLAALERQKIEDELAAIIKEIGDLKEILNSPKRVLSIIKEEILKLKEKYGDERRTKVIKGGVDTPEEEDLVKQEDVVLTVTESGYIKRLSVDTYKRQGRGGKGIKGSGLKEEDKVDKILIANTHDNILVFTNKGKVYSIKAWDVPEAARTSKGTSIANLLNVEQSEKINAVLPISKDAPGNPFLFMTTQKGVVKKTALSEFQNIRSSGIIAIKLEEEDSLEWVHITRGGDTLLLVTKNGMSIRFSEKDVRSMGRVSAGVRGIKLREGDKVIGSNAIKNEGKEQEVLVLSQNGYGKKTSLAEYKIQNRGGGGILTYRTTEKTGKIIGASTVEENTEGILITSEKGQIIRISSKDVPNLGRATQGVRLIKLSTGDRAISFTTLHEETPNGGLSSNRTLLNEETPQIG